MPPPLPLLPSCPPASPASAAAVVLDLYAPVIGSSAGIDALFDRLQARLREEARLASGLLGLQGALDMLMAAAASAAVPPPPAAGGGGGGGGGYF